MSLHSTPSTPKPAAVQGGRRELASRIAGSELPGFFSRTLEVPLGQRAVLLDGGRYVATLPAGRHALEGWKRGTGASAILVDDSAIPLRLGSKEFSSSDHQRLRVALELGLRVTTPEVFVAERVRDRALYSLDELQAEIGGDFLWVVEELVTSRGVGELTHALGRERLRLDLMSLLQPVCERSGLLLERLAGLRVEAPDQAAAKRFEQKAGRLRDEYEHQLAELQGGQAVLEGRLLRESMELEHEIESRRKVAEQKLEERRLWFEQEREVQSFAREEQMKKMWEMASIHEMHEERRHQRKLAGVQSAQSEVPARGTRQNAAGRGQAFQGSGRLPSWRRCPGHGIKYDANEGECPLCESEHRD